MFRVAGTVITCVPGMAFRVAGTVIIRIPGTVAFRVAGTVMFRIALRFLVRWHSGQHFSFWGNQVLHSVRLH
jgi:hypothetical protein